MPMPLFILLNASASHAGVALECECFLRTSRACGDYQYSSGNAMAERNKVGLNFSKQANFVHAYTIMVAEDNTGINYEETE